MFFLISQVRLGWHDAGTYNKNIEEWPQRGGANGSLRFEIEQKHAANAGMSYIIHLLLSYVVGENYFALQAGLQGLSMLSNYCSLSKTSVRV